jgi:hypothetical protein
MTLRREINFNNRQVQKLLSEVLRNPSPQKSTGTPQTKFRGTPISVEEAKEALADKPKLTDRQAMVDELKRKLQKNMKDG